MPIPESHLYRADKINIWFAISCVLMTLTIGWLVAVDYFRPWHEYQHDYYVAKAAIAHLDYLDALKQENQQQIAEAKVRRDDAQEYLDSTASEQLAKLEEQLIEAKLEFKKANASFSATSQVLDVTRAGYEEVLAEHDEHHAITQESHKQVRYEEDLVAKYQKDKELWEDRVDEIESQTKELRKPLTDAEKQLRDLETIAAEALQKDQQYRGVLDDEGLLGGLPIVSSVINAPLLDFISPRNTPARYQVNQLVLPDIHQQLNYLITYTTDRCTTCHLGIADPDFSKDRLAQRLERSLPGIMEALQRMGQDPPDLPSPPKTTTDDPIPAGQVTDHWQELTRQQQDDYFDALLHLVNKYFKASGRKTIELGQPLLAHPDLDLYVSVESPHAMAKMGCTVCHEGNPQETDFVLAAHTPPTHEIEEEWAHQYYDINLGVPTATFELVEHYWNRPMQLPRHSEAGCSKCHSQITDISRHHEKYVGTMLNRGRQLFTSVGCVNCHAEDTIPNARRVGPDLTHVASKLRRDFVEPWVLFPQKFRPSTRMPHFFMQENNRQGSENQFDPNPVLRTETEAAAITQYLFTVSSKFAAVEKPADVKGNVERGLTLFKSSGCLACHGNIAEFGEKWITKDLQHRLDLDENTAGFRYKGMTYIERVKYAMAHFGSESDVVFDPDRVRFEPDQAYKPPTFSRFAPELSGIGSKVTSEWLYSWLIKPTHYAPDTKMPNMRLSSADAADITAYLMTLRNESFQQDRIDMNADRLQMADDLIFTLLTAQRSERRSRAIMQDEGQELTQMLVALLKPSLGQQPAYDLVSAQTLEDKKLTFLGSKMIGHYGCYACHNITGFGTTTPPGTNLTTWAQKPISQLDFAFYNNAFHHMREEKEEVFGHLYPPGSETDPENVNYWSPGDNPREQITHTHSAFAKHKLRNPRLWDREKIKKPYDKLKMPNFYLTDPEAEALTTFLLSRKPALVSESLQIDYQRNGLGAIAKGRELTRELNCVACHQIEDNAPIIQQYFSQNISGSTVFDAVNAPPLLWGEGAKIQHHWLDRFLHNVETLRPWLQVRMPSFNLTKAQSSTLVEYFAALSRNDSNLLDTLTKPVHEYVVEEKKRAELHGDADEEAPSEMGLDWYQQESLSSIAKNLRHWSIEHKVIRPSELDLLRKSPKQLRQAHKKLLTRVDFLTSLYDVEYPFVEPTQSLSPDDRYETGSKFFNDMGCLKCHVFGDMLPGPAKTTDDFVNMYRLDGVRGVGESATAIINGESYPVGSVIDGHTLVSAENLFYDTGDVETKAIFSGSNTAGETENILLVAASAPNLALAHQRLRRDWVVGWMLDPQIIQPGTKMPQNFPGGESPFAGSQEYPGTGEDHINLIVDYLYDAGVKGVRWPLTKIIIEEDDGEFDDEEGFDDEEEFDD